MTARLGASVGRRATNAPDDVKTVQTLLQRHGGWLIPLRQLEVTGVCDELTIASIERFQLRAMALLTPDGVVWPNGYTITALNRVVIEGPRHGIFDPRYWGHRGSALTAADYASAATALRCEARTIQALANQETKRTPFDAQGRPTILFERHIFSKLSGRVYDRSHPDISNSVAADPRKGEYGPTTGQYPKLLRAATLNEDAALQSASWGKFQIMGFNHLNAGFASVGGFVWSMMKDERSHLDAFVSLILAKGNEVLLRAIRSKDWATIALHYNGKNYRINNYDTNLAKEYEKLAPSKAPVR